MTMTVFLMVGAHTVPSISLCKHSVRTPCREPYRKRIRKTVKTAEVGVPKHSENAAVICKDQSVGASGYVLCGPRRR